MAVNGVSLVSTAFDDDMTIQNAVGVRTIKNLIVKFSPTNGTFRYPGTTNELAVAAYYFNVLVVCYVP